MTAYVRIEQLALTAPIFSFSADPSEGSCCLSSQAFRDVISASRAELSSEAMIFWGSESGSSAQDQMLTDQDRSSQSSQATALSLPQLSRLHEAYLQWGQSQNQHSRA